MEKRKIMNLRSSAFPLGLGLNSSAAVRSQSLLYSFKQLDIKKLFAKVYFKKIEEQFLMKYNTITSCVTNFTSYNIDRGGILQIVRTKKKHESNPYFPLKS
jgi:hypothetical protein